MPKTHTIKCGQDYFDALSKRDKTFECRRDDRGYQKGDSVLIKEIYRGQLSGQSPRYTGNELTRKITYILTGGQFGIEPGYVVLALK